MDGKTTIVTRAAVKAVEKGIAVFVSAGNEGSRLWRYITAPADGEGVIAVGGVEADGLYWTGSSQGPTSDGRIKPDVVAQANDVFTVNPRDVNDYIYGGGTSFACPLAAGAGAIILSLNPHLTPLELRDWLITTASQAENPDNYIGYGLVNLQQIYYRMTGTPSVKISNFQVENSKDKNILRWTVTEEVLNRYWVIGRREETGNLQEIGRLKGEVANFNLREQCFMDNQFLSGRNYRYYLSVHFETGEEILMGEEPIATVTPTAFALLPNYPNPFNQETRIVIGIGNSQKVTLAIYDLNGKKISTLLAGEVLVQDYYAVLWNGRNDHGAMVAGGIYYAVCRAGGKQAAIKLMLIR